MPLSVDARDQLATLVTAIGSRAKGMRRKNAQIVALSMMAAGPCHAAAPMVLDPIGLIVLVGSYVLGFIGIAAVIAGSGKKDWWAWFLAVYVGGPAAWFIVLLITHKTDRVLAEKEMAAGVIENVKAFASYCQDRKRVVHMRVPPAADMTLLVRLEAGFPGGSNIFDAPRVHEHMAGTADCAKTGLAFLEGIQQGRLVAEKQAYAIELHRFRMCSAEKPSMGVESWARYELVLGESFERKSVPWGSSGGRWMNKSYVRLIDQRTRATLAEDTVYFLRSEISASPCPDPMEQLGSLIADVFPRE